MKKLMIGGQALVKLGSDRTTEDTDYIVSVPGQAVFSHDKAENVDYVNAAGGNKFFAEIWKMESGNSGELASPIALMNLKAYSLVQHCQNFHFNKADQAEYDMKFLARQFGLGIESVQIARKYMTEGQFMEVEKIFKNLRK